MHIFLYTIQPTHVHYHTVLYSYDLHTLQNRFYLHNNAIASLQTTMPILLDHIMHTSIDTIAFPDDGAAKRFGAMFRAGEDGGERVAGGEIEGEVGVGGDAYAQTHTHTSKLNKHYDIITCGKTRNTTQRSVHIQQGSAQDKHILIVDDLVQTGSTLYECACVLRAQGAKSVSVFVAHAVFPHEGWRRFVRHGDSANSVFDKFYVTNSIPTVTDMLPRGDVYEVLELQHKIIQDLDGYSV
ncbi:hypothetical protein EON63_09245 [archaeon]|nr:MAG: hypothetical protein EON63_09245 [archaeon]